MVSYCTSRSRSARRSRVETCSSSRARRTRVRSPRATRSRTAETSAEKTSSSRASAHSTSSMPSSRPACRRSSAPTPSSSDEYGTGGVTRLFTTSLSTPARRPSSRRRTSSGRRTPRSANSLRSIFLNALCTSFATCSEYTGRLGSSTSPRTASWNWLAGTRISTWSGRLAASASTVSRSGVPRRSPSASACATVEALGSSPRESSSSSASRRSSRGCSPSSWTDPSRQPGRSKATSTAS